jgi:hypothetical protein
MGVMVAVQSKATPISWSTRTVFLDLIPGVPDQTFLRQAPKSHRFLTGFLLNSWIEREIYWLKLPMRYAKGHSAQSDLFWRIHQHAALCYLLLFLCNWGV